MACAFRLRGCSRATKCSWHARERMVSWNKEGTRKTEEMFAPVEAAQQLVLTSVLCFWFCLRVCVRSDMSMSYGFGRGEEGKRHSLARTVEQRQCLLLGGGGG